MHFIIGWDINAYVAAQKEKDKQVEAVLHKIHRELQVLYRNHAPQLKPKSERSKLIMMDLDSKRPSLDLDPRYQNNTVDSSTSRVGPSDCSGATLRTGLSDGGQSSRTCLMDSGSISSVQSSTSAGSSTETNESVDPVEDMYNILEGSSLVPFLEVSHLKYVNFVVIVFVVNHVTLFS